MSATILKPFGIAPPSLEPNGEVVKKLELLLERARNGEIGGIAGTLVDSGGQILSFWADGTESAFKVLSGITLLQRDYAETYWPLRT